MCSPGDGPWTLEQQEEFLFHCLVQGHSCTSVVRRYCRVFSPGQSLTAAYKKVTDWADRFVRNGRLERYRTQGIKTYWYRIPRPPPDPEELPPPYEVDEDGWPVLPREETPEPEPEPVPADWSLRDVHYWLSAMARLPPRELADRLDRRSIESAARAVRAAIPEGE